MSKSLQSKKRNGESGFTLIELLIAGVVLVFGMLSIMGLMFLAMGNNGRSKIDSSATMLTQSVLDQISAALASGSPTGPPVPPRTIGDNANCDGTGNNWPISFQPVGANLLGGKIDFTQNQAGLLAGGYAMNYVECNNNIRAVYDVRWNVQQIVGSNGTYLVTVGARPKNGYPTRFAFALPVTMRAFVGGN